MSEMPQPFHPPQNGSSAEDAQTVWNPGLELRLVDTWSMAGFWTVKWCRTRGLVAGGRRAWQPQWRQIGVALGSSGVWTTKASALLLPLSEAHSFAD